MRLVVRSARLAAGVLAIACAAALSAQVPAPSRGRAPARPAAPRVVQPVPFAVGEILDYDISWGNFLTAGTATVSVREKKPSYGSVAYYIVAEGQPIPLLARLYPVYYKVDTLIDVYNLLPQRGSLFGREGTRTKTQVVQFDRATNKARFEVQTSTTVVKTLALPPRTQDVLSAFFAIRAMAFRPNARASMSVTDEGEVYNLQLTVAGTEPVRTAGQTVNAWRVVPTILDMEGRPAGDRKFWLWISDDARRLPVKLSAQLAFGTFNLTLRSAR